MQLHFTIGGGIVLKNIDEFNELLNNKLFNQIMDGLDDVVMIIDKDTRIVYVNKTYERVFQRSRSSIVGKLLCSIEGEDTTAIKALRLGIPISHRLQQLNTADFNTVGVSFPLKSEEAVVGSVSIFDSTKKYVDMAEKLQKSNRMNAFLKERLAKSEDVPSNFITVNPELRKSIAELRRAAQFDSTVLLTGESGTGKEVLSKDLHYSSDRRNKQFMKVNCSAISDELLERELFGSEEGSDSADGVTPGKLELAQGGTIFLDEIGDMSLPMQTKLLRVLAEKCFKRIGGKVPIALDVRIIAATNHDLKQMIEERKFRKDLYYRINVIEFTIPPIRSRKEDIQPIAQDILRNYSPSETTVVTEDALRFLERHDWPGNVREMQNVLEYSFVMREGSEITVDSLPKYIRAIKADADPQVSRFDPSMSPDIYTNTSNLEKELIIAALKKHSNKSKAIEELGISRSNFYKKIKLYDIKI